MSISREGTLVALASASGKAGVAVLRVSGPDAQKVVSLVCCPSTLPSPRRAVLRDIVDYRSAEILDHALVLFFPAPHSFTGEDVVEIHLHGGRSVVRGTLDAICSIDGVRPAEAGEFSRRAFENGKLDLTEVEGMADLVDAETSAQRRQALRQMDGDLGRLYRAWSKRIKDALAFIEAELDFADEDIPPEFAAGRQQEIETLIKEIEAHLNDRHRGERLREGFSVALLGAPNAGKSSLLNALARREAAIVSPTPGTTRDIVEVYLDLGGYPVCIADTAGLRETADLVEGEGVRRALARAEQADLKILVFDGTQPVVLDPQTKELIDEKAMIVVNKKDKLADVPALSFEDVLYLSAKTGDGLDLLIQKLLDEIGTRFADHEGPALTRVRHRLALQESLDHLSRALHAQGLELCAEDMRMAMRSIGRITGRVDVEDLLDVIFSSLCIGK